MERRSFRRREVCPGRRSLALFPPFEPLDHPRPEGRGCRRPNVTFCLTSKALRAVDWAVSRTGGRGQAMGLSVCGRTRRLSEGKVFERGCQTNISLPLLLFFVILLL